MSRLSFFSRRLNKRIYNNRRPLGVITLLALMLVNSLPCKVKDVLDEEDVLSNYDIRASYVFFSAFVFALASKTWQWHLSNVISLWKALFFFFFWNPRVISSAWKYLVLMWENWTSFPCYSNIYRSKLLLYSVKCSTTGLCIPPCVSCIIEILVYSVVIRYFGHIILDLYLFC